MKKLSINIKHKDVITRVLLTVGLLLLFRLGTLMTVPGATVNTGDWASNDQSFLAIMNMLGGGGLSTFSIFALGVSPYITASIVMQLLSADVIPPLARLNKQGNKGRVKVEKITRLVAIFIAILQAIAISMAMISSGYVEVNGMSSGGQWVDVMVYTLILVAGSMVAIWIADRITIKGIGNGISLIIFVGIVGSLPSTLTFAWTTLVGGTSIGVINGVGKFAIYISFLLALIVAVTFLETSQRKIPLQQTGKGLSLMHDKESNLPIKVNPAGVVPVIFASAIIALPLMIAAFFPDAWYAKYWMETWFALTHWFGLSLFAFLIFGFTFFYSHININPEETAENFQKSSTYIVGVKPGKDTENHIIKTVNSMAFMGAVFLTTLAILPNIFGMMGVPQSISLGGTGLIIMVSVSLETVEQLKARILASNKKQNEVKIDSKITTSEPTNKKVIENDDMSLFN